MKRKQAKPSTYDANACIPAEKVLEILKFHLEQLPGDSPETFYLKQQVFSKYCSPDPVSASARRDAAIAKWLSCEEDNAQTNERLILTPDDEVLPSVRSTFGKFKRVCSALISGCIGDVPPDEFNYEFSGGASTSRPRTRSFAASKYAGRADVTSSCLDMFLGDLISYKGWLRQPVGLELHVVDGNVMFTVPKSDVIDRCACKEPEINMFVQKGIGKFIRRSLRKKGINLNDQSINQNLARAASVDQTLATVDLSSASDSVTTSLCEVLLPTLWFSLLMSTRSPVTTIPGRGWDIVHRNEMMSSMGNGFTFELESLLFWAIARTVCYLLGIRGVVSVYGDDLIVPVAAYEPLREVLGFFGFKFNESKSYSSTPFRESCGGHYYDGSDITPFYIKGPPVRLIDLILICNKIRAWSYRTDVARSIGILDERLELLWLQLIQFVPLCYHGGVDWESSEALVTKRVPPNPKRLVLITRQREPMVGDYVRSLHQGPAGEDITVSTGRYRPKSQSYSFSDRRNMPVYLHEA